jgi:hypothetical protein
MPILPQTSFHRKLRYVGRRGDGFALFAREVLTESETGCRRRPKRSPFPAAPQLLGNFSCWRKNRQHGSHVHGSRRYGHGRRPVLYECKTLLARSVPKRLIEYHQMLFTWSTHNLCIVFRQWRITGTVSLLVSLAAIALLTAGYEGVREISRQYELSHATKMSAFSSSASSKSFTALT